MNIGIVGYAVPNRSGKVVQELRTMLNIMNQFTIFSYRHGGWDNVMAANTWLNGAPQTAGIRGRWEWEIQEPDFVTWVKTEDIDMAVFVGCMFGEQTHRMIRAFKLPSFLVPMPELYPRLEECEGIQQYLCISDEIFENLLVPNKVRVPYPIQTPDERWQWVQALGS